MQQEARTFEASSAFALTWVLNTMVLGGGAYVEASKKEILARRNKRGMAW